MIETFFIDSNLTILLQLVVAMVLGMAIGAERALAGKTAGMRTYALVAMGSCLFIVISTAVTKALLGVADIDPLRVVAGVITGVGFIGAGLIIFRERELTGLTTAAGLWVAAGVGVAAGYKLYLMALYATVLTLFVFTVVWFLENRVKHFRYEKDRVKVVDEDPTDDEPELL